MTERIYVKISKVPGKLPPEHFRPSEIIIKGEMSAFSFPWDALCSLGFWTGYNSIPFSHKYLFHLNLVDENLVFSSDWNYETIQGGVILSTANSGDIYNIKFGFVSD
jgi:hypothetical protein